MTSPTPDPDQPGADARHGPGHRRDDDMLVIARRAMSTTGPDECTLYPLGLPAAERVTTWLTAREGSFVALDAMR